MCQNNSLISKINEKRQQNQLTNVFSSRVEDENRSHQHLFFLSLAHTHTQRIKQTHEQARTGRHDAINTQENNIDLTLFP